MFARTPGMARRLALAACLAAIPAGPLRGRPTTSTATNSPVPARREFDNVLFTVPPGWEEFDSGGRALVFKAPGLPEGEVLAIIVSSGEFFTGDFAARCDEVFGYVEPGEQVLAAGAVQRSRKAGYDVASQEQTFRTAGGRTVQRIVILAHPQDRLECVIVLATHRHLLDNSRGQWAGFLQGVRFANELRAREFDLATTPVEE